MTFDPALMITGEGRNYLRRPKILAVVSVHVAAQALMQRSNGEINGFVVESPIAGGHNAPPRSKEVDQNGTPVYGPRDEPDLEKVLKLNRPVWLAGGKASAKRFQEAKASGATGIQVGSAFALSDESGINVDIKSELRRKGFNGDLVVIPSTTTSPTGFPFQVTQLEGSLSDPNVFANRERQCHYSYLVEAYLTPKGTIGFRCPAEPVSAYIAKGGEEKDTVERRCLCCGLGAAVNAAPGHYIATLGQNLDFLKKLMTSPDGSYLAADVIKDIYS